MKNIINEKPSDKLTGRLKFSTEFVDSNDIKGRTILDIGCGYGWFEIFCLKNKVTKAYGIEINDSGLKTAKKYISDKKVDFLVAGALKLPFKDNYFDTIVAWEVIEHIPAGSENEMFKEVSRVLKKQGVFYLSTPNSLSRFFDPAFWLIGHRHYSSEKLIKLGLENNLIQERIEIVGGGWTAFLVLNMYISKWIFKRQLFFKKYFSVKDNLDYHKKGFYNIFVKFRKK